MTRFVTFFTLTGQSIDRFIQQPSDRSAAVRALLEPVGGKLIPAEDLPALLERAGNARPPGA